MTPIRIYNDVNRFTIDWTLNTLCTYNCSYCHPSLYAGKNFIYGKQEDPAVISNFLNHLKEKLGSNRSVHIFLNGGEPTISPSIETILDFANENNWASYINTNGTRSMEWWQEYAHKAFKITISYHPESVDDEIFDKVAYIKTQTNVGVFTLMYPPLWNKAYNAYHRFKSMEVTVAPSRVFKRNEGKHDVSYEYTQEQLKWLSNTPVIFFPGVKYYHESNKYGQTYIEYDSNSHEVLDEVELANSMKNTFKNWKCNMGIDHIFINGNGEIYSATCSSANLVSSSIKDFSNLLTTASICKTDYCTCTLDIQIPKQI